MYHNTNELIAGELKEARRSASNQEAKILDFFEYNKDRDFTPEEIQYHLLMSRHPITSIRRAITDLTEQGYLRKTNIMRPGRYGKPVHTWQFKGSSNQEEIF